MGRTAREKLFTGVYKDKAGVSIVVSVKGKPREFRTDANGKPYRSYERHRLKDERKRVQARETLKEDNAREATHTFAHDVRRYLATISSSSHKRNAAGYLAHWVRAFEDRDRNDITELEVKTRFAEIGKANSTRNHIRRELFVFYQTLNGPHGYNPARNLTAVREKYRDARALSYDTIEAILMAIRPSPSRARLQVMAYTGLPQTLIAKLRPTDLRLADKEVYVRPRRKGAGVEGRQLPLSAAGVAALKEFQRLNAFGPFQNRQLVNTFKAGVKASGVTIAPGTRPYDLRHSFLTEVYRQTGDLKAVSELGMHATLEQTARYATGAVSERATKAVTTVPRFRATGRSTKQRNLTESSGVGVRSQKPRKKRTKRRIPRRMRS